MVTNVKIVLMGTPKFAVTPFESLIKAGYNIIGIVSQPDRKVGRKQEIVNTPTKDLANKYGIKVYQVENIKNDFQFLIDLKPDLIITCAYGQIIPQAVLELPKKGCINIHGSLLPKYRGGAPIHHALMKGEKQTGISIMKMVKKMDAGDVFTQHKIEIDTKDSYDTLSQKMSKLAADAIIMDLPLIIDNKIIAQPQIEAEVTFGYNIKPEQEKINWNQNCKNIHNHVRGLSSIPGAHTLFNQTLVKIYSGETTNEVSKAVPGSIVGFDNGIIVATVDFNYRILELQFAGKKRMTAIELINGFKPKLINHRFE